MIIGALSQLYSRAGKRSCTMLIISGGKRPTSAARIRCVGCKRDTGPTSVPGAISKPSNVCCVSATRLACNALPCTVAGHAAELGAPRSSQLELHLWFVPCRRERRSLLRRTWRVVLSCGVFGGLLALLVLLPVAVAQGEAPPQCSSVT